MKAALREAILASFSDFFRLKPHGRWKGVCSCCYTIRMFDFFWAYQPTQTSNLPQKIGYTFWQSNMDIENPCRSIQHGKKTWIFIVFGQLLVVKGMETLVLLLKLFIFFVNYIPRLLVKSP